MSMNTFLNFTHEYSEGIAPFLKFGNEKEFELYVMDLWRSKDCQKVVLM